MRWVWAKLWGFIYALAPSLSRQAPIAPVAPVAAVAPVAPVAPEPPREIIEIYPGVRGFSKPQKLIAMKKLKDMNEKAKKAMWKIADTNKRYGVNFQPTVTGIGSFNGEKDVPKGTTLFVYIAVLSEIGQQEKDKDLSYVYGYGPFIGFNCFADAKFTVGKMQTINAAFLNHSCTKANCKPRWVRIKDSDESQESPADEWYLEFYTRRKVKAGEQFTISYILNFKKLNTAYLVKVATLTGIPAERVVRCLCNHPLECPRKMGFDRLEIYGKPDGKLHVYAK